MQALGRQQVNENLKITSYTKLMEHLDVCGTNEYAPQEDSFIKAIQGDIKEVQAIRDGNGCDHVFANNPDKGIIYYYLENKFIHANGRPVPLYGRKMTAGIDKNGVVHIFALRNNKIYTSKEIRPLSGKFTEEAVYGTTLPKDFERISQICAVQMQQGFALFVVSETSHKDAFVSYRCDHEGYDYLMPVAFAPGKFAFSGSRKEKLYVHQVYANKYESFYSTCGVSGKRPDIHSLEFSSRGVAMDIFISGEEVFCCDDRSHLWRLSVSGKGINLTDVAQLGEEGCISLTKYAETIHAVSIDKKNRLVHMKAAGSEATAPFPIDTDVGAVCFCPQADGATLYYYDQAAASMIQLSYNESGQNWKEMSLALPDPETIQRYPCYSTELTLLNPKTETPLIEVDVQVWTEERTYIKVGECFYICDQEHKVDLKTDIRGKIIVVQYTNKIDACVIYASLPEHLLLATQCLAFRQFETVSGKMEKITSNDILNAKTTDSMGAGQGNLLSDQYRTEKNADALATSIKKLMSLNSIRNNCPTCKGTYIIEKNEIGTLNRICADDSLPSWSLRVEGNNIIYQDLEDSEAQKRISKIKAESICLTPEKADGFFSSIGDFFRGIVKKIVQVVEVIIKGIKTVVQFVIDSVTFVFEFVAKVIGEILDFIETIFAAVLVFFVAIFAWIAALFQWNDVKRTQRVLEGCIGTFLDAFPTINKNIKNQFITTIKKYEAELDAKIDTICASLLPDKPVMQYVNENNPSQPEEEESISNDYMVERLLKSDVGKGCSFTQDEIEELRSSVADVMEMWMQVSGNIAEDEEFERVKTYFDQTFRTIDGFFDNLLVSILKLLQGVLHLFMRSMTALISITFDAFQSMIGLLDKLLRKRLDIPFFTDLYRLMTGDELSILNVVCFVLAVPVVTIGKILLGHAPYENEKQVDDTIAYLKSIFSFTKTNRKYLDKDGRAALTAIGFLAGTVYNIVSAYQDYGSCTSQNDRNEPVPASAIDYISWVLQLAWLALSAPWIYETAKAPASEGEKGLWGVFVFGVALDGAFLFKKSHIDKSGWKGRACTTFYGFVHFLTIMSITIEEKLAAENCIPDFCGGLAESVKSLIDLDYTRSEFSSWCRFVVVPTDVITAGVVLGCGIANIVKMEKEA